MPVLSNDNLNALRRRAEQWLDQAWAIPAKKLARPAKAPPFEGDPRFALVCVNYSTTRYLKLMLLTLCEQNALKAVERIIIVDNGSRDGGVGFLRGLEQAVPRVHLLENRAFRNHARGLRMGIAALEALERTEIPARHCNLLLICDPDVIFLNPDTLQALADTLAREQAALAGELRHNLYPQPEAQASFLALRRDSYARKDVAPFVNHGAPAWPLQQSLWQAGLKLADFPSNRGGYILHRGRSGVAAANRHHRASSYATVTNNQPHYMGITDGAAIWNKTEQKHAQWLTPARESALIAHLAKHLACVGGRSRATGEIE